MYKSTARIINAEKPYPDKLFYKIGEVSRIAEVEPYVLRYWETEFSFLKPRKNKSGQRVYVKKDLELILQIKKLLYQERYTIEGVRKQFEEIGHSKQILESKAADSIPASRVVDHVKKRLRDILSQIK
ncbi:MAG: MerR family transcriptional regulator [Nitrospiraceae bacterium]|nr:MerR family transcriptional regulator [Nitrospiraceae bacterium]